MAKLLALTTVRKDSTVEPGKKQLRKTVDHLDARLRNLEIQTILMKVEDLLAEVQDARKVIDVATEAGAKRMSRWLRRASGCSICCTISWA